MSASLVGSEMCIRDSITNTSRQPTGNPPEAYPEAYQKPSGHRLETHRRPCLLYTSDAADDM
eukprot:2599018-Alexandrium_andersonii.AAC.1